MVLVVATDSIHLPTQEQSEYIHLRSFGSSLAIQDGYAPLTNGINKTGILFTNSSASHIGSRTDYLYHRYESHTPTPTEVGGFLAWALGYKVSGIATKYQEITPGQYREHKGSRFDISRTVCRTCCMISYFRSMN